MTSPAAAVVPEASDELTQRLADGLVRVNDRLDEVVDHDSPLVKEASHHLVDAGGKRFRPLLTLLTAELGTGASNEVVDAAAAVELTHLASLYHDDVMDESDLRRGVPSANSVYGNSTAILVGDLLFGKASELVAHLGSEAVLLQARTFVRLCAGQIEDERQAPDGEDPMAYYLRVLADKTGVLIAAAAQYGAMFSGCDARVIDLLGRYGELVGLVFQLSDDIIDITSDAETLGKMPGTDLREGVATLPTFYVNASNDPADERLKELLARPLVDDAEHAEALELLRRHPAIDKAREHTASLAREAAALIDELGEGDAQTALKALPMSAASRSA